MVTSEAILQEIGLKDYESLRSYYQITEGCIEVVVTTNVFALNPSQARLLYYNNLFNKEYEFLKQLLSGGSTISQDVAYKRALLTSVLQSILLFREKEGHLFPKGEMWHHDDKEEEGSGDIGVVSLMLKYVDAIAVHICEKYHHNDVLKGLSHVPFIWKHLKLAKKKEHLKRLGEQFKGHSAF